MDSKELDELINWPDVQMGMLLRDLEKGHDLLEAMDGLAKRGLGDRDRYFAFYSKHIFPTTEQLLGVATDDGGYQFHRDHR